MLFSINLVSKTNKDFTKAWINKRRVSSNEMHSLNIMTIRLILFFFVSILVQKSMLYTFTKDSDISDWTIIDDVVMGGKSYGNFYLNEDGNGVFEGRVSLENNGGFSSLRHQLSKTGIEKHSTVVLRVKGDGKKYQFRIKDKRSNYYSYVSYFKNPKEWQTIRIPLSEMYANFRGRRLNIPNYDKKTIEEIGFLIGNKTAEDFNLEIDHIALE
ncbi:MAG: CIA30 family protein [Bacteroidota bacterium]